MKKLLMLSLFFTLAMVSAQEFVVKNANMTLKYADGIVSVFAKDAEKPVATIKPSLKGNVKPDLIKHPESGFQIFSLRSEESSIAFKLERTASAFTMALNRNASPVIVNWNAQAVVAPDVFTEHFIVEPGDKPVNLPPFMPMYVGLLDNGNAMLSCLPNLASQHATLSADLSTLTLNQRTIEDYTFVLTAQPNVWHTAKCPTELNKLVDVPDWELPFPALWQISMPIEKGFIPASDNTYATWYIARFVKNDEGKERVTTPMPRISIIDMKSHGSWTSGFEGSFKYPAEIVDNKVKICSPRFSRGGKFRQSTTKLAYIYALTSTKETPKETVLPWPYLPSWVSSKQLSYTTSFSLGPATCGTTNWIQAVLRKDESKKKAEEIRQWLGAMQFFVEGIRSRVEHARTWKTDMENMCDRAVAAVPALSADAQKLKAVLAEIDRLYNESLPTIKYPNETIKLAKQYLEMVNSDMDDEEKEKLGDQLGRATRTIGGGQDNLCAYMRHVGKCVRYLAFHEYGLCTTPEGRDFWKRVYQDTEDLLQGHYGHEGR